MPTTDQFIVTLKGKQEVARDTFCFQFDLDGIRFEFLPGQFVDLSLPGHAELDADNKSRTFSIASAPEEGHLSVATRLTGSPFKKALAKLKPGDEAMVNGPNGRLVFDAPEPTPMVFLAGGIGITPFRSILKHALDRKIPHRIVLIYSNRTPTDASFLEDLKQWHDQNKNFTLLATMTQLDSASDWNGKTDRIDAAFLRKHVGEFSGAEFYTAGPPRFVKGMKQSLEEADVPRDRIHAEEFAGY